MVLLPNGNVFETGGALIDREDPVYEASMINMAQLEAGAPASVCVHPDGRRPGSASARSPCRTRGRPSG
jgi:hypothetical protein